MKKIAVIGMGNMGKAIFEILISKDGFDVSGCDRDEDANTILSDCEAFIIAVKPQDFLAFAESVNVDLSEKLAISIMAGVNVDNLRDKLGSERIVRVMPNLPLKIGKALSGWFGSGLNNGDKNFVREILRALGAELELDVEDKIDSITALSGSGPAYFYYLTELLADAAKEMGFSDEEATLIARETFKGSAQLLGENDPAEMRAAVTSKGGTTEAALTMMTTGGMGNIFMEAVKVAKQRATELNKTDE